MLVGTPGGEPRKVLEDTSRTRVEDVRAVLVHEEPRVVVVVERIAPYVIPSIAQEDALTVRRQTLRAHAPREACADDKAIEHERLFLSRVGSCNRTPLGYGIDDQRLHALPGPVPRRGRHPVQRGPAPRRLGGRSSLSESQVHLPHELLPGPDTHEAPLAVRPYDI